MIGILFMLIGAVIPSGWPMLRCNQQRTGYTPGESCFDNMKKKWDFLAQNSESDIFYTSPTAADFTLNTQKDILITPESSGFPMAEVHRGTDGGTIWESSLQIGGPSFATSALMDINGDNRPEIFLHSYYDSKFMCLNGTNGSQVWVNNNVIEGMYSAPLVIESPPTVIVGDDNGVVWSLDATNGTTVNWSHNIGTYIQPPSYGDVDGDGTEEIVIVAGVTLYVYELDGTEIWNANMGDSATTPMLIDLDADPTLEIVVYCYRTGYVKAFNYGNTTPFINTSIGAFTADLSGCEEYVDVWPPSPAGGDINGDGIPDILIHNGGTLFCIRGSDGGIEWQNTQTHLFGSPVIANLDKNDYLEIVVTGCPGTDNHRSKIELYDHTGTEKWEWISPLSGGFPDPILNEACLADIDNDGRLEIFTIDYSCFMVCLDCEPSGVMETEKAPAPIRLVNSIFKDKVKLVVPQLCWLEYKIYDVMGRVVEEGRFSQIENTISINIRKTGGGVYFLKIKTPTISKTFKLVKLF